MNKDRTGKRTLVFVGIVLAIIGGFTAVSSLFNGFWMGAALGIVAVLAASMLVRSGR